MLLSLENNKEIWESDWIVILNVTVKIELKL